MNLREQNLILGFVLNFFLKIRNLDFRVTHGTLSSKTQQFPLIEKKLFGP